MATQYKDLLGDQAIRSGGLGEPEVTLANLWQLNEPTIGQECGYTWRVELQGNSDYPKFNVLRVRVAMNARYVTLLRTLPSNQERPDGEIMFSGGPGAVLPGFGVSYSKKRYVTDQISSIVGNEGHWNLRGKPDKQYRLTLDGSFFIVISGSIPENEKIELRFTASARFSGKRLVLLNKPPNEPSIPETTVAQISPMKSSTYLPGYFFPIGPGLR